MSKKSKGQLIFTQFSPSEEPNTEQKCKEGDYEDKKEIRRHRTNGKF